MNISKFLIGVLGALLLVGCVQQAPQRPSQRKSKAPEVDSAQLALMELNQQLAQAADEQVRQAVMQQSEPYALYEAGAWMTILERGDEQIPTPAVGQEQNVQMRIYTLSGQLLEDLQASYHISKHELPQAVDENIDELHPGGRARIYAPWYTAFGMKGTNTVPPYENVMIEIELR